MYGLNPLFLKDKEGFLKRVKAAGCRFVEPCLALSPIPGLEDRVWTEDDLAENMPLLEKYGFSICSAHVFTADILSDLPELIRVFTKFPSWCSPAPRKSIPPSPSI